MLMMSCWLQGSDLTTTDMVAALLLTSTVHLLFVHFNQGHFALNYCFYLLLAEVYIDVANVKHCLWYFLTPTIIFWYTGSLYSTSLGNLGLSYFSNMVIFGDFNIDFFRNRQRPSLYKTFSITSSFQLCQVVSDPTHNSPNGDSSLIDWALLSNVSQLKKCTFIPPLCSSGIALILEWRVATKTNKSKPRIIWKYSCADFTKAHNILDTTDWNKLLFNPVDVSTTIWHKVYIYMNVMNECRPQTSLSRRRNLPWLDNNICKVMRKSNYLYRRAKKSGWEDHLSKYKALHNKIP